MASSVCFPATSAAGNRRRFRSELSGIILSGGHRTSQLKTYRSDVRSSLDTDVSDMSVNGKLLLELRQTLLCCVISLRGCFFFPPLSCFYWKVKAASFGANIVVREI